MHLRSHEKYPVYEAMSYTWGIPNFTHHITCDGTTELSITLNVDIMLRHLRKTSKPRYLWVDAICLNQSDENEKAIQIGMMGHIYKEARKVNIWLGDA
ncbi:heterokaryon incompatibility, partial [Phaeosphaeriaceae sp. PMI808]